VKLTRKIENHVWKLKKILYTIKQNKIEPKWWKNSFSKIEK
jgi:hypothetical protein